MKSRKGGQRAKRLAERDGKCAGGDFRMYCVWMFALQSADFSGSRSPQPSHNRPTGIQRIAVQPPPEAFGLVKEVVMKPGHVFVVNERVGDFALHGVHAGDSQPLQFISVVEKGIVFL